MKATELVAAAVIATTVAGCGGGGGGGGVGQAGGASTAALRTATLPGTLVEARVGHTSSMVEDGLSVLITGGETLTRRASSTAELWRAGRSVPLASGLSVARVEHRAVPLPTGEVWIVGGRDAAGTPLSSTEVYDPQTRAFAPGPRLSAARVAPAICLLEDGVMIAFGEGQDTIETWSFDLEPRATFDLDEAQGRSGDEAFGFLDGTIYLTGGAQDDGRPAAPIWLDPTTGAHAAAPGLPGTAVAAVFGDLLDGFVVAGEQVQRVRRDEVTVLPTALRTARTRGAAASTRGAFAIAGGLDADGRALDSIEVVTEGGSSMAPALLVARHDLRATTLADGSVLFTGGRGQDGLPASVTDLLVPAGARGPDAGDVYARARAERDLWERTVAERDAAVAEGARLSSELDATRADLAATRADRQRLEGELARARSTVRDLEARVAALQDELRRSQQQTQALKDQLAAAQQALATALQDEGRLQGELAAARARARDLEREDDDLRRQVEQARARLAQLEGQVAARPTGGGPDGQLGAVTNVGGGGTTPFRIGSTGVGRGTTFGAHVNYPSTHGKKRG